MAKSLEDVLGSDCGEQVTDNNNNTRNDNDQNIKRGIKRPYEESFGDSEDEENPLESISGTGEKAKDDILSGKNPSECQGRKPTGGKYQLRPRSLHPRRLSDADWNFPDVIRDKPRPPPLSRYRRKTANARERYRMKQINSAFENLRGVLPSWVCSRRPPSDMTKIATLRLAAAYIRSLQDILDGKDPNDTCSWVLSALLEEDTTESKESQPSTPSTSKIQECQLTTAVNGDPERDLVSLLCASSGEPTVLVPQENLDTFSYLAPMAESEAMALFLGCDPPPWNDSSSVSLV